MFDTVMVAIDGSQYSNEALAAAGGIAAKAGSHVEVVHVHEHDFIPGKSGVALDLERVDDAQTLVDKAVESLSADGITVKGRLLRAQTRDVPRAIIDAAKESGADLIIVGRRGLSSLTGMVFGSVSNKIVQVATVPVMVAHWGDPVAEIAVDDAARRSALRERDVNTAHLLEQPGTFIR
jgi:nucleotide-binding universal stress UspA family protein